MMQAYADATLDDKPLTGRAKVLVPYCRDEKNRSFPPLVVFSLLFLVVALLSSFKLNPSVGRIVDRVLFTVSGLAGLFLCFMWFGTAHWCTAWNLNILWLSPLLILVAIRLERSPRWALWLQEGCFLAAMVWVVWCGLSLAIIPAVLTLSLRVGLLLKGKQVSR